MFPKNSNLFKTYSSATSKKAGEGVPYQTVLQKEVNASEQILPAEADVVIIGIVHKMQY